MAVPLSSSRPARRAHRRSAVRALALLLSASVLPLAGPTSAAAASPAPGNCAVSTARGLTGTVYGQDGRDVNASVGFSVVDAQGRAIGAELGKPGYGCPISGYSVPQRYVNHFVSFEGAAPGTVMPDGTRTRRDWSLSRLPSNAAAVWIEAYSRGYAGSPCKDAQGRWCFNPTDVRKYGYANRIKVPVSTRGVPVVLPTTCAHGGTAGSIVGKGVDAAGRPVTLTQVYAWTEHAWGTAPAVHGWGSHKPTGPGYQLRSLAADQRYVVWAYGPRGNKVVKTGVLVKPCSSTPLDLRV